MTNPKIKKEKHKYLMGKNLKILFSQPLDKNLDIYDNIVNQIDDKLRINLINGDSLFNPKRYNDKRFKPQHGWVVLKAEKGLKGIIEHIIQICLGLNKITLNIIDKQGNTIIRITNC